MASVAQGPILLCYDGSDGSRRAVEWTGLLLPGAEAIVLHLWESPAVAGVFSPPARAAAAEHEKAVAIASEGVELARGAGLAARPFAAGIGASWQSILAVAQQEGARLIVTGARGVTGARALLGSVSQGVTQHAHIPVLVVPPPPTPVATSAFVSENADEAHASASARPPVSGFAAPHPEDALARYVLLEAGKGRDLSEILTDEYVVKHASTTTLDSLLDRRDVVEGLGRDAAESLRAQIAALRSSRQDPGDQLTRVRAR
jgi:nucleotide-binding universal stress UspA family protein